MHKNKPLEENPRAAFIFPLRNEVQVVKWNSKRRVDVNKNSDVNNNSNSLLERSTNKHLVFNTLITTNDSSAHQEKDEAH